MCTATVSGRGTFLVDGSARGEDFYMATREDFSLAIRGDLEVATREDFFMATDRGDGRLRRSGMMEPCSISLRTTSRRFPLMVVHFWCSRT